jgi:hypothetical protein
VQCSGRKQIYRLSANQRSDGTRCWTSAAKALGLDATVNLDIGTGRAVLEQDRFRSKRLASIMDVNLALNLLNRAGFTLQPPRRPLGKVIQSEAVLL